MFYFSILKSRTKYKYYYFTIIWLQCLSQSLEEQEDIFRQNIGEQIEIGIADKGYKNAQLNCGHDSMIINLETEDEFSGVIYLRGNFYERRPPCFYDAGKGKPQNFFQIKFGFDQCKTKKNGDVYSNVLILQHDNELIMPGDVAFKLECDYNKLQDVIVKANMLSENSVTSRITLINADPSPKLGDANEGPSIENQTNIVVISPEILKRYKEEL